MKRLIAITVILAGLWSAFWYYNSGQKTQAIETWFEEKRSEGWTAEYSDMSIAGFPNRADVTFEDLRIANPEGTIEWSAPFFQLFALIYNLDHLIAIWPNNQSLQTPYGPIALQHENLRASIVLSKDEVSALERFTMTGEALNLNIRDNQWTFDSVLLAAERQAGATSDYKVALDFENGRLKSKESATSYLPSQMDFADADMRVSFEHPWNASSFLFDRPKPSAIEIVSAEAKWGALNITGSGAVTLDENGVPEGAFDFAMTNWRELIGSIANSGAITHSQAQGMRMMVGMLAGASGDPNVFEGTLAFENGNMRIGQMPLGPAPRISPY